MLPALRYGLHPLMPVRLGFRGLLGIVNPRLAEVLHVSDPFTLVTARRRVTLARVAQEVLSKGVDGDFVEFGVHRGGTAAILAQLLMKSDRKLHLFDRWGDLPEPTAEDGRQQQNYARTNIPDKLQELIDQPPLESTKDLIERRMGFARTVYYQGWYEDTLPTYQGKRIAFASVDCDYYKSVALVLDFIAENAAPGCAIVVDDYDEWPGARQATDEFCAKRNLPMEAVLGQAVIRIPEDRS